MPKRNIAESEEWQEWKIHARRGKIGFALFLLLVGIFWLLRDMGYIPLLPFWPLVLIVFALFLLFSRM